MSTSNPKDDFAAADALIEEFLRDVRKQEGTLSGGRQIEGIGTAALTSVLETRVSLGSPKNFLLHLTPERFQRYGYALSPQQEDQLGATHDFYVMEMPATIHPSPGVVFQRVTCELDFGPKGTDETIIQSVFPGPRWHTVLEYGGQMKLGLDANLTWTLGVDNVQAFINKTGGAFEGRIENANQLSSFVNIPSFCFESGRSEISVHGPGESNCRWIVSTPELRQQQTLSFITVFKVPRGTKSIELTGKLWAEPSIAWLASNLPDTLKLLKRKFQLLLAKKDSKRTGVEWLPRGYAEEWILDLPVTD